MSSSDTRTSDRIRSKGSISPAGGRPTTLPLPESAKPASSSRSKSAADAVEKQTDKSSQRRSRSHSSAATPSATPPPATVPAKRASVVSSTEPAVPLSAGGATPCSESPSLATAANTDDTTPSKRLLPRRPGMQWVAGARVDAMDFKQKWYAARIVRVDEEKARILVHFDGWNARYDEWLVMRSERLRAFSLTCAGPACGPGGKETPQLHVGDVVFARWTDGCRYPAEVTEVSGTQEAPVCSVSFYDGMKRTLRVSAVQIVPAEDREQVIADYRESITKAKAPKSVESSGIEESAGRRKRRLVSKGASGSMESVEDSSQRIKGSRRTSRTRKDSGALSVSCSEVGSVVSVTSGTGPSSTEPVSCAQPPVLSSGTPLPETVSTIPAFIPPSVTVAPLTVSAEEPCLLNSPQMPSVVAAMSACADLPQPDDKTGPPGSAGKPQVDAADTAVKEEETIAVPAEIKAAVSKQSDSRQKPLEDVTQGEINLESSSGSQISSSSLEPTLRLRKISTDVHPLVGDEKVVQLPREKLSSPEPKKPGLPAVKLSPQSGCVGRDRRESEVKPPPVAAMVTRQRTSLPGAISRETTKTPTTEPAKSRSAGIPSASASESSLAETSLQRRIDGEVNLPKRVIKRKNLDFDPDGDLSSSFSACKKAKRAKSLREEEELNKSKGSTSSSKSKSKGSPEDKNKAAPSSSSSAKGKAEKTSGGGNSKTSSPSEAEGSKRRTSRTKKESESKADDAAGKKGKNQPTSPLPGSRTKRESESKADDAAGRKGKIQPTSPLGQYPGYVTGIAPAVASKAFKVEEDHNPFKCYYQSCDKAFRKQTLLLSHVKHYHTPLPDSPAATPGATPETPPAVGTVSASAPVQPLASPTVTPKTTTSGNLVSGGTPVAGMQTARLQHTVVPSVSLPPPPAPVGAVGALSPIIGSRKRKQTMSMCSTDSEISVGGGLVTPVGSPATNLLLSPHSPAQLGGWGRSPIEPADSKGAVRLPAALEEHKQTMMSSPLAPGPPAGVPAPPLSFGSPIKLEPGLEMDAVQLASGPDASVLQTPKVEPDGEGEGQENEEEENCEIINCVCCCDEEMDLMVQCEMCLCWQHAACFDISKEAAESNATYVCFLCGGADDLASARAGPHLEWFRHGTMPKFKLRGAGGSNPGLEVDRDAQGDTDSLTAEELKAQEIAMATHHLIAEVLNVTKCLRGIRCRLAALEKAEAGHRFHKKAPVPDEPKPIIMPLAPPDCGTPSLPGPAISGIHAHPLGLDNLTSPATFTPVSLDAEAETGPSPPLGVPSLTPSPLGPGLANFMALAGGGKSLKKSVEQELYEAESEIEARLNFLEAQVRQLQNDTPLQNLVALQRHPVKDVVRDMRTAKKIARLADP